MRKIVCSS